MFNSLVQKIALQKAGLGNLSLPKDNPFAGGNSNNSKDGGDGGMNNPFANMQWPPKFTASWQSPPPPKNPVREPPLIGARADSHAKLPFPSSDGRPVVVLFLRYCGCPFTEKLFLTMRSLANRHTSIRFVAVSHCTEQATKDWVNKIGGAWNVEIVVDQDREVYALWGLGMSSYAHLLNPRNGFNQIKLGKTEGVWGQQIGEGGCRWQTGGAYAVDERGLVKWGRPMNSVDEALNFDEACQALGR